MDSNDVYSAEVISFGNKDFGKAIEKIVEEKRILNKGKNIKDYDCGEQEFAELFKSRGLNVGLLALEEIRAGGGVLHPRFLKMADNGIIKDAPPPSVELFDNKNSFVDPVNIKVGGWFSKIPALILMSRIEFGDFARLTPPQATSIILHEVGHVFFGMFVLGQMTILNLYLTSGVDVLLGKKPNKFKIKFVDPSDVPSEKTEENLRKAILTDFVKQRGVFSGEAVGTSVKRSEQAADLFAVRLGYGRALVESLTVYNPKGRMYDDDGVLPDLIRTIGLTIFGSVAAVSTAFVSVPLAVLFAVLGSAFVWSTKRGQELNVYDNPEERYKKIKRDLIHQLKDPSTSKDFKKELLSDIEVVDGIIKNMSEFNKVNESIGYILNPSKRRNINIIRLENELESLLNNEFFVKSSKLSTGV